MPGSDPSLRYLLVGALAALLLAWEAFSRRSRDTADADVHETGELRTPASVETRPSPNKASLASLLSYLGAVGGVWLIPWAAALYALDPVALLPGLLLVGFILICARYALQAVDES
jgi:hypothetical protein